MPRLSGPLFSLTARGSIAGAITYSAWRGIQYARTRVIPGNPRTTDQVAVREVFKTLNKIWNNSPSIFREPWTAFASGQPFTNRNVLIRENVGPLQGQSDLANFVFAPGGAAAPPPAGISVSAGADQLTVTLTAPTIPVGWSIVAGQAAAIQDGDPNPMFSPQVGAAEDTTTPYAPVITGLTAVGLFRVGGWFKWLAPDGEFRYSAALVSSGTPT